MPSDKCNSIMAVARGLISWLFNITLIVLRHVFLPTMAPPILASWFCQNRPFFLLCTSFLSPLLRRRWQFAMHSLWLQCETSVNAASIDSLVKDNIDLLLLKMSRFHSTSYPPLSPVRWCSWFRVNEQNIMHEEVIHRQYNLFSVQAGTQFVQEMARLFQSFADGSAIKVVLLWRLWCWWPFFTASYTSRLSRSSYLNGPDDL